MSEKRLAWSVCLTSTIPRLETTSTFLKSIRHSGTQRSSYARLSPTLGSSMFLWFRTNDLGQRNSCFLSYMTAAALTKRYHSDVAASKPANKINSCLSEGTLWLPTESHTYKLGQLLGRNCRAGDVILLFGDLGVGKTALARGYIHSAHSDDRITVTSPTYLLLNSYPTPKQLSGIPDILHMDLWRLEDASQRPIADFKKAFDRSACLIEWPDRLRTITPSIRLEVHISYIKEDQDMVSTEDDPWGFGIDDPYMSNVQQGRYVSLKPYGTQWNERVETIVEEFSRMDATEGATHVNN